MLFSILAVVTGGNSYRSIETFIKVHCRRLNAAFGLRWKRAPAHTAIRYILRGLDPKAVEQVFRHHAAGLLDTATDPSRRIIALDGKTLRQSLDNFNHCKAAQVLHAFDTEAGVVLAHVDIEEKSNEIPAAQQLLGELQLAHCIVTLDAMHCQKINKREAKQMNRSAAFTHAVEGVTVSELRKLEKACREFFKAFEGQNFADLSAQHIQKMVNAHGLSVDDLL